MKAWIAVLMMLAVFPVWGRDNTYQELDAKLKTAESRLDEVRRQITVARRTQDAADGEMRRSVSNLVKVGQYPHGFWLVRSMVTDAPLQANLVSVIGRQQVKTLQASRAKAGALTTLYGKANAQLQDLRTIQTAYADARGRLMAVEKRVLRRAGMQAEALEKGLAEVLENPLKDREIMEGHTPNAAGGLPVAGRVVRSFGKGEGAAKAGVVLKAPEGAPVRATQAAKVLFAGPFRHFGGLVIVKTVRGEDVLLGGMGQLHVNAGDDVTVGQQLGSVGEDGRIYWEKRLRGRVVNPL